MAHAFDVALDRIREIQADARREGSQVRRPCWPLIVLRSPKGWTGPRDMDGKRVEGFWRSHQVPIDAARTNPAHLEMLENWMRSYAPEELFDADGRLLSQLQELAPNGAQRMGANPNANGGVARQSG